MATNFDESLIEKPLGELGYRKIDGLTYRADWSRPEVEHTLHFKLLSRLEGHLDGSYGIRHAPADLFSTEMMVKHDPGFAVLLKDRKPYRSWLNFSFIRLLDLPGIPSISTKEATGEEISDYLSHMVGKKLLPRIRSTTSLESFYEAVVEDQPLMPWFCSNGAIRAAQAIATGRKLGRAPEEILSRIQDKLSFVSMGLRGRPDPGPFLASVLAEWEAWKPKGE